MPRPGRVRRVRRRALPARRRHRGDGRATASTSTSASTLAAHRRTTAARASCTRSTATARSTTCSPTSSALAGSVGRSVIVRKSAAEIEIMREAGRITARALRLVGEAVAAGRDAPRSSTRSPRRRSATTGAVPAFQGYHGFPATLCTSLNEQVVHGIPSSDVVLRRGRHPLGRRRRHLRRLLRRQRAPRSPWGRSPSEARRLLDATAALAGRGHRAVRRRASGSSTSATPCSASPRAQGSRRRARVRRSRHRPRDARGAERARTTGRPARGRGSRPGMVFAIEPMVNAGGAAGRRAARRLDGRDAGRLAVGALRAHGRGDRRRARSMLTRGVASPSRFAGRPCRGWVTISTCGFRPPRES